MCFNIFVFLANCSCLRSGSKHLKASQEYPRAFGRSVAEHHLQYMQSATWPGVSLNKSSGLGMCLEFSGKQNSYSDNFPLGLAKDGAMMQEMRAPNRCSSGPLFKGPDEHRFGARISCIMALSVANPRGKLPSYRSKLYHWELFLMLV